MAIQTVSFTHTSPIFDVKATINTSSRACSLNINNSNSGGKSFFNYEFKARIIDNDGYTICSITVASGKMNYNNTYTKTTNSTARNKATTAKLQVWCGDSSCKNSVGGSWHDCNPIITFDASSISTTGTEKYVNGSVVATLQRYRNTTKSITVQINITNLGQYEVTNNGSTTTKDIEYGWFYIGISNGDTIPSSNYTDFVSKCFKIEPCFAGKSSNVQTAYATFYGLNEDTRYVFTLFYFNEYLDNPIGVIENVLNSDGSVSHYLLQFTSKTSKRTELNIHIGTTWITINQIGTSADGDISDSNPAHGAYTDCMNNTCIKIYEGTREDYSTDIVCGNISGYIPYTPYSNYEEFIPITNQVDNDYANFSFPSFKTCTRKIVRLKPNTLYTLLITRVMNDGTELYDDCVSSVQIITKSINLTFDKLSTSFRDVKAKIQISVNQSTNVNDCTIALYNVIANFYYGTDGYDKLSDTYGYTDIILREVFIEEGHLKSDNDTTINCSKKDGEVIPCCSDYSIPIGSDSITSNTGIPHSSYTYAYILTIYNSSDYGGVLFSSREDNKLGTDAPAVKIWNGSEWKYAMPRVWNGSEWKYAFAKVWDGSEWRETIVLKYDSSSNSWIPKN